MTTSLVSLTEAKDHIHESRVSTVIDADLTLKIEIASDILLDFLKLDDVSDDWYDDSSPPVLTIPPRVKGCVLLMTAEMYQNRESSISDVLSEKIKDILRRSRDPALA